jgi:cell division protein FtsZ
LLHAVKGISDLINIRGLINLDFADIRTVMQAKGMAIMGSGLAAGDNRAVEAATQAISSPLLENICIDGATGIIINVTGGPDLTLWEVNEASTLITEAAHPDAEIIFGAVIDETMGDMVSVTVIATGFGTVAQRSVNDQMQRLNAVTEAQLMNAGMNQLNQSMASMPQSYENINLNMDGQMGGMPSGSAMGMSSSSSHGQALSGQASSGGMQQMSPGAQMPPSVHPGTVATPVAGASRNLPREALLAKARAYRESQMGRPEGGAEQLSMNVEDSGATRIAPEPARSPFEADNLDVPAFLRRKRGLGVESGEGIE